MANLVRMRNKHTNEIKYMPEVSSRLAAILQNWVVEDFQQTEEPVSDQPAETEEHEVVNIPVSENAIDFSETKAVEITETEAPKTEQKKPAPKRKPKRKTTK